MERFTPLAGLFCCHSCSNAISRFKPALLWLVITYCVLLVFIKYLLPRKTLISMSVTRGFIDFVRLDFCEQYSLFIRHFQSKGNMSDIWSRRSNSSRQRRLSTMKNASPESSYLKEKEPTSQPIILSTLCRMSTRIRKNTQNSNFIYNLPSKLI